MGLAPHSLRLRQAYVSAHRYVINCATDGQVAVPTDSFRAYETEKHPMLIAPRQLNCALTFEKASAVSSVPSRTFIPSPPSPYLRTRGIVVRGACAPLPAPCGGLVLLQQLCHKLRNGRQVAVPADSFRAYETEKHPMLIAPCQLNCALTFEKSLCHFVRTFIPSPPFPS